MAVYLRPGAKETSMVAF